MVEPAAAADQQQGGDELYGKLIDVAHAYQVVGYADEVEQHAANDEEQQFGGDVAIERVDGQHVEAHTDAQNEAHGRDDSQEEGGTPQLRHEDGVQLPLVGYVVEPLLVGDQQDVGRDEQSQQQ